MMAMEHWMDGVWLRLRIPAPDEAMLKKAIALYNLRYSQDRAADFLSAYLRQR